MSERHTNAPAELLDNRADPDARAVLEDWDLTRDHKITRLGVAIWLADADADADAAAAADAAADADAAAAADADADAAAAAALLFNQILYGEIDMRDGLKLIQLPGRYGYSVTRIGWIRRVGGDEWELLPGTRTVIRTSGMRRLDELASDGPKRDHSLSDPSKAVEEIHRLLIRRAMPVDEKVWATHFPRPENWER